MSSIAAVVFDLDDTLYPERDYAFSGFAAVAEAFAARLGNPAESAARMRRLLDSEHRPRVFDALLADLGRGVHDKPPLPPRERGQGEGVSGGILTEDRKLVDRMIEVYRTHRPTIRLFHDADVVLTELHGNYRLGLLTDGRTSTQWAKIDALGLRDRFDAILITAELGPGFAKPSPRPFDLISTRLQVEGSRAVYVADNPGKDFIAPNALGWMTIQVRRPEGLYGDQSPALGGAPQHVIDGLDQLVKCLHG